VEFGGEPWVVLIDVERQRIARCNGVVVDPNNEGWCLAGKDLRVGYQVFGACDENVSDVGV